MKLPNSGNVQDETNVSHYQAYTAERFLVKTNARSVVSGFTLLIFFYHIILTCKTKNMKVIKYIVSLLFLLIYIFFTIFAKKSVCFSENIRTVEEKMTFIFDIAATSTEQIHRVLGFLLTYFNEGD